MRVKDLIKVLQSVSEDEEVTFTLGKTAEYREKCAKVELAEGECLNFLVVDEIKIFSDDEDLWLDIVLKQYNHYDIDAEANKFDEYYKQIQ